MTDSDITTEHLSVETWKPVPEFEGVYSVSSFGRIRRDLSRGKAIAGFILKLTPNKKGYLTVTLSNAPQKERFLVHCLVMRAFVGPCPEGKEVNHKDTIKANCHLDNLEYVTGLENMQHAVSHGLLAARNQANISRGQKHSEIVKATIQRGDNHYTRRCPEKVKRGADNNAARITPEIALAIIRLTGKERQIDTAARFSISRQQVGRIQSRKQWQHLD